MTESSKKAREKYDKKNTVLVSLKLNRKTDADILEYIEKQKNKQGTIKEIIRSWLWKTRTTHSEISTRQIKKRDKMRSWQDTKRDSKSRR